MTTHTKLPTGQNDANPPRPTIYVFYPRPPLVRGFSSSCRLLHFHTSTFPHFYISTFRHRFGAISGLGLDRRCAPIVLCDCGLRPRCTLFSRFPFSLFLSLGSLGPGFAYAFFFLQVDIFRALRNHLIRGVSLRTLFRTARGPRHYDFIIGGSRRRMLPTHKPKWHFPKLAASLVSPPVRSQPSRHALHSFSSSCSIHAPTHSDAALFISLPPGHLLHLPHRSQFLGSLGCIFMNLS